MKKDKWLRINTVNIFGVEYHSRSMEVMVQVIQTVSNPKMSALGNKEIN